MITKSFEEIKKLAFEKAGVEESEKYNRIYDYCFEKNRLFGYEYIVKEFIKVVDHFDNDKDVDTK